ncbi:MAG: thioesterase domain-containing protein [Xanthobacteraceae bacterium]
MSGAGQFIAKSSLLRRACASALMLCGLLMLPAGAHSATRPAATHVVSRPHVFLMRGLLNIFSLGMDQLAVAIAHHGIDASVYNHTFADSIVGRIVQMYRAGDHGPYMLIGHSLGADAVMAMAQELNAQGVPVALVVPVDGTGSSIAPRNVACVINLTQRSYAYMRPGAGFHGVLDNVDFSGDPGIDHLTIDKSPRVQAEALRYVLETARAQACRPGTFGPVEARSREMPKRVPSAMLAAPKVAAPTKTASPALRPGFAG